MFFAPRRRISPILWLLCAAPFALSTVAPTTLAQEKTLQTLPQSESALPLPPDHQMGFVMAMVRDGRGDIWCGTEDAGVWRFDSKTRNWRWFSVTSGLGDDNAYALAVDKKGRIWAGHLNHGVSVWNGAKWQNFGVLDGPLGERVFSIATCPSDGDVWMATNAGLSRYSLSKDTWSHYTKADGLPSHEISALSFDSVGNLYVGTQCDGLAIAKADDNYAHWQQIKGAEAFPDTPAGSGLPSNLINDVLVADDDTIYVATTCGLARSHDFGENWTFLRGGDWEAKLKGLYAPRKPIQPAENLGRELLREDYITSIAEDAQGFLWLAYRQKGYEIRRPLTDRTLFVSAKQSDDPNEMFPYISALLPQGDGTALIGTYSQGLQNSVKAPPYVPNAAEKQSFENKRGWRAELLATGATGPIPALPIAAKAPSLGELNALLARLETVPRFDAEAPLVVALDEDWNTQGDWLGRYGRYGAVLCAMASPTDLTWGSGEHSLEYNLRLSPKEKGNSLRYWVHWLNSDNKRVLEMPPLYFQSRLQKGYTTALKFRRQSEVDDNGEDYPLTRQGPDVYATVRIPRGLFVLSFYNHNKDGHHFLNRMRDYRYSVRAHTQGKPLFDVSDFDAQPELARSRQRDFWGGVYKRYLVRGPQELTVEMSKNNSFNTILAGMFLDLVEEEPAPYFGSFGEWEANYEAEDGNRIGWASNPIAWTSDKKPTMEVQAVEQLWQGLERARVANPGWWMSERRRFYAPLVVWLEASKIKTPTAQWPTLLRRLSASYYNLSLYEQWEKAQKRRGLTPAREVEKSLVWDGQQPTTGNQRQLILAQTEAGPTQPQGEN